MLGAWRRTATVAIGLALVIAPLVLGAGLAEEETDDELAVQGGTADFEGPSWAAWRVKADEDADSRVLAKSQVTIEDREDSSATSLHCFKFNKGLDSLRFGFFWTRMATATNEVSIGDVDVDLEDGLSGLMGLGCGANLVPGGEVVFVSQAGSDGEISGTFEMLGDDALEVTGFETGDSLYALAEAFDGLVNVVTRTGTLDPSWTYLHAKAVHDASIELDVDGHLVGAFEGQSNSGQLEMGFDGPQGEYYDGTFGPKRYLYLFTGPQDPVPRAPWFGGEPGEYEFGIPQHVDTWDRNPYGPNTCAELWGKCSWIYTPLFVSDVDFPT